MRKIFALLFCLFVFASCDNKDVSKESETEYLTLPASCVELVDMRYDRNAGSPTYYIMCKNNGTLVLYWRYWNYSEWNSIVPRLNTVERNAQ